MRRMIASTALVMLVAGCSAQDPSPATAGEASLGISRFQVSEGKELTTIAGFDAQDKLLAKLELVHGRFAPTDDLGQAPGEVVDGRKLSVSIGDQSFTWQTVGFDDTTRMPSLPSRQNRVAAFVADEHVRPVLRTWKIGWDGEPVQLAQVDEVGYASACDLRGMLGTTPFTCGSGIGAVCWIGSDGSGDVYTQACAGTAPATSGFSTLYATGDSANGDNAYAAFCCEQPTMDSKGLYAYKTCASKGHCSFNGNHQCSATADCGGDGNCTWSSICGSGTGSQKCVACNQSSYTTSCLVSTSGRQICHDYL